MPLTPQEIYETVSRINADQLGVWFATEVKGDDIYVQIKYMEPDVNDSLQLTNNLQKGRLWLLTDPQTQSKSAVIKTCFAALMASQEHRAREWFTYKGRRVMNPHIDVEGEQDNE